jgi:hypothetical protein
MDVSFFDIWTEADCFFHLFLSYKTVQTICVLLQIVEKGGKLTVDLLCMRVLSSYVLCPFPSACQYIFSVRRSE